MCKHRKFWGKIGFLRRILLKRACGDVQFLSFSNDKLNSATEDIPSLRKLKEFHKRTCVPHNKTKLKSIHSDPPSFPAKINFVSVAKFNLKYNQKSIYLLPLFRYSCVIHGVQRLPQILAHHNCAVNCQFQIAQIRVDSFDDPLHPINFLSDGIKIQFKI